MESNIVTKEEIKIVCPKLDVNFTEPMIAPYILQAQQLDLTPFIGAGMYYDLVSNPTTAENVILLEGGISTLDGNPIFFTGIKTALSQFAYSRILEANSVHVGLASNIRKDTEGSEKITSHPEFVAYKKAQSEGKRIMIEVEDFLEGNLSDYPLYSTNRKDETRHLGFRFHKVENNNTNFK